MTKNNYTTLVSCRIDNSTLKAVDDFCSGHGYLKRSGVINQAITKLFHDYDVKAIYDFLYNRQPLKK